MNYKRVMQRVLCGCMGLLLLSGCSNEDPQSTESGTTVEDQSAAQNKNTNVSYDENDYYTDYKDSDYEEIDLGKQSGDVTITKAGCYVLSGSLKDGSVIVDAKDQVVRIVLNNALLYSSDNAPVYVKEAEKVILSLPEGTNNTISDGKSYQLDENQEPSAAIFSKDDLTINGSGSLKVTANVKNGIQSKDILKLMSGTYDITAANDGIKGKDALYIQDGTYVVHTDGDGLCTTNTEKGEMVIEGGSFEITAKQDGMQSESSLMIYEGTFTITSGGGSVTTVTGTSMQPFGEFDDYQDMDAVSAKGIKAVTSMTIQKGTFTISSLDDALHSNGSITLKSGSYRLSSDDDGIHADQTLKINGGTIDITQCYEGLEAGSITISGGTIKILASDDGINAASESGQALLNITGGSLYVNAYGDGVDSNQDITMSGGTLVVMGPQNDGNGALDYDGTFTIDGGTLIALGGSGMAMAPSSSSTQNSVMINLNSSLEAGTLLYLQDEEGNFLLGVQPERSCSSVVISSPKLTSGETISVMSGGTASKSKDGVVVEGAMGSEITTLTLSDTITTYGSSGLNPLRGKSRP